MLTLYNVLTRKKEKFKPLHKKWVGLYTCGPTVYNFVHVGNLRTYIFEDVLRRTLEYAGYRVRHIMNITDIDDKVIKGAGDEGKTITEFVTPYTQAFFEDIKKLNIQPAFRYPKATRHIPQMIALIKKLLTKKLAYASNGSVYFDIAQFKRYGRLSRLPKKGLKSGARVDVDEYEKSSAEDFVLWKAKKAGEPFWNASFGQGRPGWHIECSAMSMHYLGKTLDIHAGGVDLIFPHHENEIAQSEGATGKKFVTYFIEGEHLLIDGKKMAKSLGNFITLRDIEAKGFHPLEFRYLVLTSHYRSPINFTWESLEAAHRSLERLYDFIHVLKSKKNNHTDALKKYKILFEKSILNDLDTPKALAIVWNLMHDYHKNQNKYNPKNLLQLLYDFDNILGLGLKKITPEIIPSQIHILVEAREKYRKEKNWAVADTLRKEIEAMGWLVKDTSEGPKLKRK